MMNIQINNKTLVSVGSGLIISLSSLSTVSHAITIDFESFDTSSGFVTPAANSLQAFGVDNISTSGGSLGVFNEFPTPDSANAGGGNFLTAPSSAGGSITMTLDFAPNLESIQFTRISGTGATSFNRGWTYEVFDEGDSSLGIFSGDGGSGIMSGTVAASIFSYNAALGSTIGSLSIFTPNNGGTFAITPIDDLVLNFAAPSEVPVPAAAWLFGSGLLGLIGVARRKRA